MNNATNAAAPNRNPHIAMANHVEAHGSDIARELYEAAKRFNREFFEGKLAPCFVEITLPASLRALATYQPKNPEGVESCIRISPSVVTVSKELALDALLHEMIHAWMQEVEQDPENGYAGHGPKFAAKCNEIGEKLGLGPVSAKGRGEDGRDCAQWPLNVRPKGYYGEQAEAQGRVTRARKTKAERTGTRKGWLPRNRPTPEPTKPSVTENATKLATLLRGMTKSELEAVRDVLSEMIAGKVE